jgi:predicted dehydrogenase
LIISSEQAPLRLGIVGVGSMGRNHARILAGLRGVTLVGVVDSNPEQAETIARLYGCAVFAHIEDLIGKVDAVTIAAPSIHHAEIGRFMLANGIHCMVEKPLATTEADCRSLIEAGERNGLTVMVGHIERFNPAVLQLREILDGGVEIYAIEARRMSRVSQRITDVTVVMDLMIHDIDIVLELVGRQPIRSTMAQGVATPSITSLDHATALIGFQSGTTAVLTASRITENTVRELTLATDIGFIVLGYRGQELQIFRQQKDAEITPRGNYRLDVSVERVQVRSSEPLLNELSHFVDVIRSGAKPRVDGYQALEAMRVAWDVEESIRSGCVRSPETRLRS